MPAKAKAPKDEVQVVDLLEPEEKTIKLDQGLVLKVCLWVVSWSSPLVECFVLLELVVRSMVCV